jgi:bifunctional DNA-binding transcriptional regulator/antitoxin component of YhaV-PrlF toxin-antitoxin module
MGNIDTLQKPTTVVTLAEDGGLAIPETLRGELGFLAGDRLVARVVDGALVLESVDARIRRAQDFFRGCVPEGVSLVDELIAERHAEAERE